ncbi:MAG: hypothetical protein ABIP55_12165 [Tepidisphaeraceae bacterium]
MIWHQAVLLQDKPAVERDPEDRRCAQPSLLQGQRPRNAGGEAHPTYLGGADFSRARGPTILITPRWTTLEEIDHA